MQTERQPYEPLVRWNQDGKLAGAHVQWRLVITDENGEIVGETVTTAEPVAMGQANGFPLEDILAKVQADALAELEAARVEIETYRAERAKLDARVTQLSAEAQAR
jgi:hypothetical protein